MTHLCLKDNLIFEDLYTSEGLRRLDQKFLEFLSHQHPPFYEALIYFRKEELSLEGKALSSFLIELSPYIEAYVIHLFPLDKSIHLFHQKMKRDLQISKCRRSFIQKRVAGYEAVLSSHPLSENTFFERFHSDEAFAHQILEWLEDENKNQEALAQATHYAAWALYTPEGQRKHRKSVLFKLPAKVDFMDLVPCVKEDNLLHAFPEDEHKRLDFNLQAPLPSSTFALREAHYCLYCHEREKDSCSKGLKTKEGSKVQVNPLGISLNGCPLNQKISEMNQLYSQGIIIGALAVITLDNPFVAATGFRICNDCSKACIFQKQDPVHIPAIESRILKEVLELPWGFEIYSLLTRWNPLNIHASWPKPLTGYRILVVGQGPAGFTLAHHLLNEGHEVLAIDGLKIEPLSPHLKNKPLFSIKEATFPLEERTIYGFGGVAEYGITHRWDKNNLTWIRMLLERRNHYTLKGSVRFSSQITAQSAFQAGFDHIALCTGAGQPKGIALKNSLAPGVYFASDFLMSMNLQGIYRPEAVAAFDLQAPLIVIGGGLTAIDTATEALAYLNQQQKKKFPQDIASLFHKNDVQVVYRRRLQDAPAYRLNDEEIKSALKQGIKIREDSLPLEIILDDTGHVNGLKVLSQGQEQILSARTILIAVGTVSSMANIRADLEHDLSKKNFITEPLNPSSFLIYCDEGHRSISVFGDLHPHYSGSVVKAMASAREGMMQIQYLLSQRLPSSKNIVPFIQDLDATVIKVTSLTPSVTEIIVKAPAAARAFQPGQFFRLQNYGSAAFKIHQKPLLMEPLALTGASADPVTGLLSLIILKNGVSSTLATRMQEGDQVSLMGPTGHPTYIPHHETVLLMGGGLGNAILFSIGKALKNKQNKVLYMAGYKSARDVFYQDRLEAASDQMIWCWEKEPAIQTQRAHDTSFQGNIIEVLINNARKRKINLQEIDRLLVVGPPKMMMAIQKAREKILKPYFFPHLKAFCSVNSPMQCMMKGLCGQCIQRHFNPMTGDEKFLFTCVNQYQDMDLVDFSYLTKRLEHNQISEEKNWGRFFGGNSITIL